MRLSRIDINCFRSIKKATIFFNELTAIVGENNAGKSAVLRSINAVFNFEDEEPFFKDKTHRYSLRSTTRIAAFLSEVPDDPFFSDKLSDGKLVIVFYYNYSNSKQGRKLYYVKDEEEKVAPLDLIPAIKQYIDYVYIKASRSDEDLSWSESSIFKKLVTEYLAEVTHKRDSLSIKAQNAATSLKPVFSELCRDLVSVNMLSNGESFAIHHKNPVDYSVFLQNLAINVCKNNSELEITEYGSGIKSVTVIALYRLLAKLKKGAIILAIEEPETNLHPQAQKKLIASLQKNRQDGEIQAIFATHSTVIVDSLDHRDVVLVRRVPDEKREFHSKISQLPNDFWEKHDITSFKHENFFKVRNSDFFFSKYVVVVEGSDDAMVYERLLKNKLKDGIVDVSFIQLGGVKSLKYPYFLLKDLDIPFTAIVDYDFFVRYKNGKLNNSRDADGFPEYQTDLVSTPVVNDIWNTEEKKSCLSSVLGTSYSKLFDVLSSSPILCLKYCLEIDLVHAKQTRLKYYEVLHLPEENQNTRALLVERQEAIKDSTVLRDVVFGVRLVDLPSSFKKIAVEISKRIGQSVVY